MTPDDYPDLLPLGRFAREVLRRDESWASHLRRAGRLAMTADGLVRVQASLERIAETQTARGATAAALHAQIREEKARAPARDATGERTAEIRREKAEVDLRLRRAQMDREEMERDRLAGKLIDREEVGFAMRHRRSDQDGARTARRACGARDRPGDRR